MLPRSVGVVSCKQVKLIKECYFHGSLSWRFSERSFLFLSRRLAASVHGESNYSNSKSSELGKHMSVQEGLFVGHTCCEFLVFLLFAIWLAVCLDCGNIMPCTLLRHS